MDDNKTSREIILTVGQRYPEWQTGQDGYRLEWNESAGFILLAMLTGISPLEKDQFSPEKELAVRYTVIEDVCYFTFRFGEMPWADCPFSPTLYRTADRNPVFPNIEGKNGLSLTVLLIDSGTGELCAVRLIGLGHDFSAKWLNWAKEALKTPFDFAAYSKRIDRAYTAYSSADFAIEGLRNGNEYIVSGSKPEDEEKAP